MPRVSFQAFYLCSSGEPGPTPDQSSVPWLLPIPGQQLPPAQFSPCTSHGTSLQPPLCAPHHDPDPQPLSILKGQPFSEESPAPSSYPSQFSDLIMVLSTLTSLETQTCSWSSPQAAMDQLHLCSRVSHLVFPYVGVPSSALPKSELSSPYPLQDPRCCILALEVMVGGAVRLQQLLASSHPPFLLLAAGPLCPALTLHPVCSRVPSHLCGARATARL